MIHRTYIIAPEKGWPCKVGISNRPSARLVLLQNAHYEKMELICIFETKQEIEYELHKFLNSKRIRGEWFDYDAPELMNIIQQYLTVEGIKFALLFKEANVVPKNWTGKCHFCGEPTEHAIAKFCNALCRRLFENGYKLNNTKIML